MSKTKKHNCVYENDRTIGGVRGIPLERAEELYERLSPFLRKLTLDEFVNKVRSSPSIVGSKRFVGENGVPLPVYWLSPDKGVGSPLSFNQFLEAYELEVK